MKRWILLLKMLLIVVVTGCSFNSIVVSHDEQKDVLLRQRIAENWQAMIDGDRLKVYSLYDPFFRTNVSTQFWGGLNAPGRYYSFEIKKIDIQDNVAYADTEVEYSYNLIGKFGQKIERERTKAVLQETWLFIDGNWWRQFRDGVTEGTYAHY